MHFSNQEPFFPSLKEKLEASTLVFYGASRASSAISHLRPAQTPLAALFSHLFRSVFQRERYRARQRTFFPYHPSSEKERKREGWRVKKKRNGDASLYTRPVCSTLDIRFGYNMERYFIKTVINGNVNPRSAQRLVFIRANPSKP